MKSQTLKAANGFLNELDFESMVSCLLEYLHHQPKSCAPTDVRRLINPDLCIVLPCAGQASRWNAAFLPRKHKLDLGDNAPLIEKTIEQVTASFPASLCSIIDSNFGDPIALPRSSSLFQRLTPLHGPAEPVGIEILESSIHHPSHQGKSLLWLYGDVSFTWNALEAITSRIAEQPHSLGFFGRKYSNEKFANSGGEIFGVYVPCAMKDWLLLCYRLVEKLAIGMPLARVSTWEIVSYISLLEEDSIAGIRKPSLINNDAQLTYNMMISAFSGRSFPPSLWVEINDETEDFDYPFEYIRRLYWLALK